VAAWYLWRAVDLHKAGKLPAPITKTRMKLVKKRKPQAARVAGRKKKTRPGKARAKK
jgi:hypothetical protein